MSPKIECLLAFVFRPAASVSFGLVAQGSFRKYTQNRGFGNLAVGSCFEDFYALYQRRRDSKLTYVITG